MRSLNPTSRPAISGLVALAIAGASHACVDTSLPDLSSGLGTGPTDGPYCSPEALETFPPDELRLHVIDVGQGDALWIQTPYYESALLESRNILIDAGPSGSVPGTSKGGDEVVAYMLEHGLVEGDVIHALVITHAHEDHYGGGPTVAATFVIESYVDPGYSADAGGFLAAREAAEADVRAVDGEVGVPIVPALVPSLFAETDLFGAFVEARVIAGRATLLPSGNTNNPSGTDINNTSVAFAVTWGGNQLLLMADLESEVEAQLIAAHDAGQISLKSRVLKVAHHGSSSSTSPEFLQRVFPSKAQTGAESQLDWAVISSGRRSFSGVTLPTEETLANLAAVLLPNHLLSTENGDQDRPAGSEEGDDHILVRFMADGRVEACYAF